MKEFIRRSISVIGVIITALPLLIDRYSRWENFSWDYVKWYDLVCVIALVASVIALLFDIYNFIVNRDKVFSCDEKGRKRIAKYLNKKISNSQKVAIFSRDLTWVVRDSPQYNTLEKKSKAGELILFLENDTHSSQHFASLGAEVKKYNIRQSKGYDPKIRFTILNFGLSGRQALIGFKNEQGKHVIRLVNFKEHPEILDIMDDYISFLRSFSRG